MKAAACLWKVHGSEQRVAVIICAVRCLHLQLSCKWGRKKGEAAVLGLCLSLLAESLANEDFLLHLKKPLTYLKHCCWKQEVAVSEGLWLLHPLSILLSCSMGVCGRIWCCSCSQLRCAAPRPKMFAPIIFADVTACSNMAELWPHNTSCVTTDFLFPVNVNIFQAERIVLFCFDWCLLGVF